MGHSDDGAITRRGIMGIVVILLMFVAVIAMVKKIDDDPQLDANQASDSPLRSDHTPISTRKVEIASHP
jgi:hypothetical protein